MKINRTINQQTLKELAKSIAEMAKILGDEAAGIECKSIIVEKSTTDEGIYQVGISIKLNLIDSDLKAVESALEMFK